LNVVEFWVGIFVQLNSFSVTSLGTKYFGEYSHAHLYEGWVLVRLLRYTWSNTWYVFTIQI